MSSIIFTIHGILNVDTEDQSSASVQIRPISGIVSKDTSPKSTTVVSKKRDKYTFESNNILSFELLNNALDNVSFAVKIVMVTRDGKNSYYDGSGKIINLSSIKQGTRQSCLLYDEVVDDIDVGEVLYSWELLPSKANANTTVESSTTEINNSNNADNVIPKVAKKSNVSNSPNLDKEENSSKTLERTTGSTTTSFQDTGLVTEKGENFKSTSQEKKIRPKKIVQLPAWANEYSTLSRCVIDVVQDQLSMSPHQFSINVYSTIHTSQNDSMITKNVTSLLKFSLYPVPGKNIILRSKGVTKQQDNLNMTATSAQGSDSVYCFDYHHQSVSLNLSASDINSKSYLSGGCPMLKIEYSYNDCSAQGMVYFPELLNLPRSRPIEIQLRSSNSTTDLVTVLFEVSQDSNLTLTDLNSKFDRTLLKPLIFRPAEVHVNIIGLLGVNNPTSDYYIETLMLCNNKNSLVSSAQKIVGNTIEINDNLNLESSNPDFDIININIYSSLDALVAQFNIPLYVIKRSNGIIEGKFLTYLIEKSNSSTMPYVFTTTGIELVCVCKCYYDTCVDNHMNTLDSTFDRQKGELMKSSIYADTVLKNETENFGTYNDNNYESNLIAPVVMKKKFDVVKSIAGQLQLNIYGFIEASSDGETTFRKTDFISGEIYLSPEVTGVKRESLSPMQISSSTGLHSTTWKKEMNMNIVWALQQRSVSFIRGSLSVSDSRSKTVRTLGHFSFDISSLINITDNCIVVLLPLSPSTKSIAECDSKIGHVMIGLTFIPQTQNLLLNRSESASMNNLCSERWTEICSQFNSQWQRQTSQCTDICGCFSTIEVVNESLPLLSHEYSVLKLKSNDKEIVCDCVLDRSTATINVQNESLNIPVNIAVNTSIVVNMKLCKIDGEDICFACLVLPRHILTSGRPMNMAIPLRDSTGLKICVIVCGFHFASSTSSMLPSNMIPKTSSHQYVLDTCVVEGVIWDARWMHYIEPYFECAVRSVAFKEAVDQTGKKPLRETDCVVSSSTVNVNVNENWNANILVPIPKAALDAAANPVPSTPLWSLHVTCRDASRVNAPIISSTHMSLPWSLLNKGKEVEQWLTLVPPSEGSILDDDSKTRIRVRIGRKAVSDNVTSEELTPKSCGVGKVMMWFYGVKVGDGDSKIAHSNEILKCIASVNTNAGVNEYVSDDSVVNSYFRSEVFETRRKLAMSSKIADVLAGSIEVPGGNSEIGLRISLANRGGDFLTNFTTMMSLAKDGGSASGDIPLIDTILRPDNFKLQTTFVRSRMSRLKYGAVFVPYVSGHLNILPSNVIVHDTASDRFAKCPQKMGALRFSLGCRGNAFTRPFQMVIGDYVSASATEMTPIEIPEDDGQSFHSSLSSKSKTPDIAKKNGAFQRNFREIKVQSPKKLSKKHSTVNKSVPKNANLKDVTASDVGGSLNVSNSIYVDTYDTLISASNNGEDIFSIKVTLLDLDEVGRLYCMGIGYIQTASLYFQAVRKSISKSKNRPDNTITTTVKLYDPQYITRTHVATVTVTYSFDIASIYSGVIESLRQFKSECNNLMSNVPRSISSDKAELGLKQAFQIADKDNSGGVSSSELVKVIQSINSSRKQKKTIVGLDENASNLLVGVMTLVLGHDSNEFSEDNIMQLFRTMDLDGDGNVSWWEWKQILEAAVVMVQLPNASSARFNLLDPLIISIEAAHSFMKSQTTSITINSSDNFHVVREDNKVLITSEEHLSETPSKTNFRLHEKINTLRMKNNKLQQKLDEALFASQFVASLVSAEGKDDIMRQTEEQSKQAQLLFEAERKRRIELEYEINNRDYNTGLSEAQSQQSLNRKISQEKLLLDIERQQQELEELRSNNKLRNNAASKLQRQLAKYHDKRVEKEVMTKAEKIAYDKEKIETHKKMIRAAITIQRNYRGHRDRNRRRKIIKAIDIICRALLRRKDQKCHLADVIIQKLTAANKIQTVWEKHHKNKLQKEKLLAKKENNAASLIQSMQRKR
jgi:Ca2+-binding EF-hand superfamily protein